MYQNTLAVKRQTCTPPPALSPLLPTALNHTLLHPHRTIYTNSYTEPFSDHNVAIIMSPKTPKPETVQNT